MIEVINASGTSRSFGPVYIFDSTGKLKFVGGGGGGSGTVTSIATTSPITGGTITDTGTIGINQATTTTDGYLSSTDWNTFNNKVPYTGATTNVDLGEYELKAGQIEFDQTPTGTAGVAVMRWNDADGTVDLGMKGSNVTLQIGQEQLTRVVNKTGSNLLEANYQAVKISGAQGNRLKVALAQANNDANSAETLGIVTETILNNQEGFVTTSGIVRGINTTGSLQSETWADGDMLYLSGTIAGQLTNIKPTAPIHTVIMGYVVRAHATQGQIYVKVDNGYELDELHNVSITTPANNDLLTYESSTSLWKNKQLTSAIVTTALGYTPYNSTNPNGYITSSALSPYLTSAIAASTYQPIGSYQAALSGTGFVKISGTTISYDNTSYYPASNPANFAGGTVTSVAALTLGTSGTDLSSSVANGTTTPVITLNVPTASASNRGVLSSTDWSTFNSKQNAITVTNSGTSGAATLVGSTLNIPIYGSPVYAKNTTTYTSVGTGTQALTSLLIPANTFVAGDILRISARFIKTGTSNSCQANILINTSASVSGGTVIKASVMTATQIGAGVQGQIVIVASNSSQYGWTPTTANSDFSPSTGAFQTGINTNWGANQYIIFSGNPSGTDSLSLISYFIEKL